MSDSLIPRLKQLIVTTLKLEDVKPSDLADDEPLIGSGLNLDSIDALELVVTLEKEFTMKPGHTFSIAFDVFNLFNNKNYTAFTDFACCGGEPDFGTPRALLTLPRRLQVRTAYRF